MWRPSTLTRTALCAAMAGSTGCYAYLEHPTVPVMPGDEIRLSLRDDRDGALRHQLGDEADVITGRLSGDTPDTVVVLASSITYHTGMTTEWRGERVAVPRQLVGSIATRQFSPGRTGLLAGALLAAGFAARTLFSGTNDNTNIGIGFPKPGGQ